MSDVLTGRTPAEFRLSFHTDQKARKRLENRIFGKRILFTNRVKWTVAEVVAAYRSQSEVESGFRQMKDPHVLPFSPMHHWTDSKIRAHVFYCVLALTIAHLMRRDAERAGLHPSVPALLTKFAGTRNPFCCTTTVARTPPRPTHPHRPATPPRKPLYDLFALDRYAPTR